MNSDMKMDCVAFVLSLGDILRGEGKQGSPFVKWREQEAVLQDIADSWPFLIYFDNGFSTWLGDQLGWFWPCYSKEQPPLLPRDCGSSLWSCTHPEHFWDPGRQKLHLDTRFWDCRQRSRVEGIRLLLSGNTWDMTMPNFKGDRKGPLAHFLGEEGAQSNEWALHLSG